MGVLEGITILDVVNTGALGMMFYFVLTLFGELKEIRKDNKSLTDKLLDKISLMEKHGHLPTDEQ